MSAQAVTTTNGQSTVTVGTGSTADGPTEIRTVTTGGRSGTLIEVTSGLKAIDKVIVDLPAGFANRTGGTRTGEGGVPVGGEFPGGGNGEFRSPVAVPRPASGRADDDHQPELT